MVNLIILLVNKLTCFWDFVNKNNVMDFIIPNHFTDRDENQHVVTALGYSLEQGLENVKSAQS